MRNMFLQCKFLFSAILLSSLFLNSCNSVSRIFESNDIVYNTKRFELELTNVDYPRRSPVFYSEQNIVKLIKEDNTTYILYDLLMTKSKSYKIDDKVFMLINNQVFPLKIGHKEYEYAKQWKEDTDKVLKADSTQVTVVTGYSENNKKITRFQYNLSSELVSNIEKAKEISLRYYIGPDMVTLNIKGQRLARIQELIRKE